MDCRTLLAQAPLLLMEGALGERLKREFGLRTDGPAGMAGLVTSQAGRAALSHLWGEYIQVARKHNLPFLATTPTRRADRHRLAAAGLPEQVIEQNVRFLASLRDASGVEMAAGGMVGCVGNAYTGEGALPFEEALAYHRWEVARFAQAGVDFFFAGLMPTLGEAMGMAVALQETGLPFLISFTVQADGRLIDGTPISQAIEHIDALTNAAAAGYMTNCVHPAIVAEALSHPFNQTPLVRERFFGLQANASPLAYQALDASGTLFTSDPETLAEGMVHLAKAHGFRLFGGCCGTDARHLDAMASRLVAEMAHADGAL